MKEKHKDILEIVGLTAIVASVLFLAFELRQSNRIAIASTEIGIRELYSEHVRLISSNVGVAELLTKAKNPDAEWTELEYLQARTLALDSLNVWLAVETACDNEMVQEVTCTELVDDIRTNITVYTSLQPIWRYILENYPSIDDTLVFTTIRQTLEGQERE